MNPENILLNQNNVVSETSVIIKNNEGLPGEINSIQIRGTMGRGQGRGRGRGRHSISRSTNTPRNASQIRPTLHN